MATCQFPDISSAEREAYELLIIFSVRSNRISEHIRTMEPNLERLRTVNDQVWQDLRNTPGSIAHGPSRFDVRQRADYLKRCREVFDGNLQTLYEYLVAGCAVFFALQALTELELGSSKYCNFLMNEAHNRAYEIVTNGRPSTDSVPAAPSLVSVPERASLPSYPKACTLDIGSIIFYKLDGISRECHVFDMGTSRLEGDYFVVRDGLVGEQLQGMKISAAEMEELVDSSDEIVYA
ncbi:hypothetical protein BDV93DRAFT_520995 [Ceratobasidium sp. AG-I]|nr:hypothetical protein BDV93DRAFT_520995 [Ceratobasidium sp. AG-I]